MPATAPTQCCVIVFVTAVMEERRCGMGGIGQEGSLPCSGGRPIRWLRGRECIRVEPSISPSSTLARRVMPSRPGRAVGRAIIACTKPQLCPPPEGKEGLRVQWACETDRHHAHAITRALPQYDPLFGHGCNGRDARAAGDREVGSHARERHAATASRDKGDGIKTVESGKDNSNEIKGHGSRAMGRR